MPWRTGSKSGLGYSFSRWAMRATALDAVGLAPGLEVLQELPVLVGEARDELAGALKGYVQLCGRGVELLVALHGADGWP